MSREDELRAWARLIVEHSGLHDRLLECRNTECVVQLVSLFWCVQDRPSEAEKPEVLYCPGCRRPLLQAP